MPKNSVWTREVVLTVLAMLLFFGGPVVVMWGQYLVDVQDSSTMVINIGNMMIIGAPVIAFFILTGDSTVSKAQYFLAKDGKIMHLNSAKDWLMYPIMLGISFWLAPVMWEHASEVWWSYYVLSGGFVLAMFLTMWLVAVSLWAVYCYNTSPSKGTLYRWTPAPGSNFTCGHCEKGLDNGTYGSFQLARRRDHTIWSWVFSPNWRYYSTDIVCSGKCRNAALRKYIDAHINLT